MLVSVRRAELVWLLGWSSVTRCGFCLSCCRVSVGWCGCFWEEKGKGGKSKSINNWDDMSWVGFGDIATAKGDWGDVRLRLEGWDDFTMELELCGGAWEDRIWSDVENCNWWETGWVWVFGLDKKTVREAWYGDIDTGVCNWWETGWVWVFGLDKGTIQEAWCGDKIAVSSQ